VKTLALEFWATRLQQTDIDRLKLLAKQQNKPAATLGREILVASLNQIEAAESCLGADSGLTI
jgi:predicted DNA-binding protein